jgi:uncharacterized membrane-anchored protein
MRKIILAGILAFFPAIALAQTIQTVLQNTGDIVSLATPIAVAFALLFFFFGLARYILSSGDEEKKESGRSIMIWGIIALFVMVAVWGLVNLIADTFSIDTGGTIDPPFVDTP